MSVLGTLPLSAATLTATYGGARPNFAVFKSGETVPITFTATGASGMTLTVVVKDVFGTQMSSNNYAVSGTPWTSATINLYNGRMGFFRVEASLNDGTKVGPVMLSSPPGWAAGYAGPMPANSYVSYAIVPNPSSRPALSEDQSFFGMQGGFSLSMSSDLFAMLGVRWILDGGWSWKNIQPYANQLDTFAANPGANTTGATNGSGGAWALYSLPNMTKDGRPYAGTPDVYKAGTFAYNTGALDPNYNSKWQNFATRIAQQWPAVYPSRVNRFYEVTWEPIPTWGYAGTAADIVTLYQLAYNSIHNADSTAKVMGPCVGIGTVSNIGVNYWYMDAGLASYLDAYSCHTYMDTDADWDSYPGTMQSFWEPEKAGQPALAATMKKRLRAYKNGTDIPMIGTEQGWRTRQNVANELDQARRTVRGNLMLMGEGWKINTAFQFNDYPSGDNLDSGNRWEWGMFYNLDPAAYGGYGPSKVMPRAVAPAYAAMTFMVEGRKPVNTINWLADSTRGYAFEKYSDSNDVMLVLWDFEGPRSVTINTGGSTITMYDWMGNQIWSGAGGTLGVNLTKEPVYIKGVAASIWGSSRTPTNIAVNKTVTTSGDTSGCPGSLAVDGDVWSYESRWVSTSDSNAKWLEINLGGSYSVTGIRFYTGGYNTANAGYGTNQNFYNSPFPSYRLQQWNGSAWVDIVSRTGNIKAAVDESFTAVTTTKIRLYLDAGTTTQAKLHEIQVLGSAVGGGGPNLAIGKTASASSIWDSNYSAAKANDASMSTRWNSGSGQINNQWVQIDLGGNMSVNQTITKESAGMLRITAYKIQHSTNGSTWSDLVTGTTVGTNKVDSFTAVTTRYVRIYITTASNNPTIDEFEIYGSGATAPVSSAPSGSLVVGSDTWTWGAGGQSGGWVILKNGVQANGGQAIALFNNGGTVQVIAKDGSWWQWNGSAWSQVYPTTIGSSPLSIAPSGSLVAAGITWTWGAGGQGGGYQILINGVGNGSAVGLFNHGGTVQVICQDATWYQWGGSWSYISSPSSL